MIEDAIKQLYNKPNKPINQSITLVELDVTLQIFKPLHFTEKETRDPGKKKNIAV